jgi:hypothetical protein
MSAMIPTIAAIVVRNVRPVNAKMEAARLFVLKDIQFVELTGVAQRGPVVEGSVVQVQKDTAVGRVWGPPVVRSEGRLVATTRATTALTLAPPVAISAWANA